MDSSTETILEQTTNFHMETFLSSEIILCIRTPDYSLHNKFSTLQAEVQLEVEYTAPDMCDLFLGPEADRASADDTQQSEDERFSEDGRMSEDEMLLEDVKRNIDRLEKGLAANGQEIQQQPQQSTSKAGQSLPRPPGKSSK